MSNFNVEDIPNADENLFANARFVKVLIFTCDKRLMDVEKKVNEKIVELVKGNNKIISITTQTVGNAPFRLIYNIIYEHKANPCEERTVVKNV